MMVWLLAAEAGSPNALTVAQSASKCPSSFILGPSLRGVPIVGYTTFENGLPLSTWQMG